MRLLYAVKMIEPSDFLKYAGRPAAVCEYILNDILENPDENVLSDIDRNLILYANTGFGENCAVYNIIRPIVLNFVPIEIIEEKMIMEAMVTHLNRVKEHLMSLDRINKIETMIYKFESKYETLAESYDKEKTISSPCFMLMYENDKLIDVYTATPKYILDNVINGKQEYKCNDCGSVLITRNSEEDSFVPEMYYEGSDQDVKYYCVSCAKKHEHLKHVGE